MLNREDRLKLFKGAWGSRRPWLNKAPKIKGHDSGSDISDAVYSAYLDSLRRYEKYDSTIENDLMKLAESLEDYLLTDNEPFNHRKWSDDLRDSGKLTYGQAQKIINMAFKYYYCCDDAPDDYKFYDCHMPLDRYTLAWVKDITGVHLSAWSKIDNYEIYLSIQTEIAKYLKNNTSNLPTHSLEAEFEIWDRYRNKNKQD